MQAAFKRVGAAVTKVPAVRAFSTAAATSSTSAASAPASTIKQFKIYR